MAAASLLSVFAIPADAIDYDLARGLDSDRPDAAHEQRPSAWRALMTCRPLLVFAVCVMLFHFANAAMLPLVGQELAQQDTNRGTALMSGCIVGAQVVMVPMAALVGAKADAWGRKPLFLAGLAVLALRGVLYVVGQFLVAARRADHGRCGGGLVRCVVPADRRRPDPWHGALQC